MLRYFLIFLSFLSLGYANIAKFKGAILKLYNNPELVNINNIEKINSFNKIKIGRIKLFYDALYLPIEYYIEYHIFKNKKIIQDDLNEISFWKEKNFAVLSSIYSILENQYKFIANLYLDEQESKKFIDSFKKQKEKELEFIYNLLNDTEKSIVQKNLKFILPYLNIFSDTYYLKLYKDTYGEINFKTDANKLQAFLMSICNYNEKCLKKVADFYDKGHAFNKYFISSYKCFVDKIRNKTYGNIFCLIRFKNYYDNEKWYYSQFLRSKLYKKIDNNGLLNIYSICENKYIIPSNLFLLNMYKKEKKYLSSRTKEKLLKIFGDLLEAEKNYFLNTLDKDEFYMINKKLKLNYVPEKIINIFYK